MFGSTPPSLQLNFNTPQAAIGFYVTDIGDGGGQLNLTLANGATKQIQIPHKIDNNISGSKFYFGYIDVANPFTKVTFSASTSNDGYGIDDITVARVEQVKLLTDVPVIVRTTDGRGGIADQNFKIHVQPEPGNYAPMIITDPVTQTYNSVSYTYNLKALDPDNDSLTYSLVKAPNGMTIDANTGMISWSTPVVGQQDVTVRVQDSRGGLDTQSFKLDVSGIAPGQIRGKVYTNDPLLAETNIPITAITTADNHFLLYYGKADGSGLTYVGRGDRWESVHSFNLNLKPDDYLYIVAWNDPDATPRMWLGEFNLPNGVTLLSNDSDWQVMVGSGRNPNFTQSSPLLTTVEQDISRQTWSVPQQAAPNVGGQVWGQKQGISSSAEFLWYDSFYATTPTDANYLIFRSTTPVGTYFVNQYKQGLAGQTVYLDTNQNHKRDLDEPYTLTDEQGNYSFAVSPNTYSLAGDLASEWNQISPAIDTYELTVATGEIVSGYDFVYTKSKPHPTFDNSSPIFTNEPITTVEAGKKLLYRADATDPEGDTLIYELLVKPDGMIVDPVTGFLSWRPTLDQVGVQDVVLRVKDNYGGVALQSFQVEVTPPVYPPTFTTSISDFATFHPVIGQLFEYQFKAVDPEGYSVTYQLDTAETTAFIDPDTGLFSWTPTTLRSNLTPNGAFQFGLSAIDEQGKKSTFLFELLPQASQSSSNSFPTIISSPRKSIALGQSYVYIVQASDPDFDALTYSLEAAPDGMSIDQQGRITWQPKTTQLGSNPVSIKISDGRGGVVTQAFDIDVVSTTYRANNAPSIVSTPNLVTNLERIYAYNLAGSDSDGDLLLWSLDSSPAGMVIDPQSGALRWQPQADQIGKHTVVVRLTDAYGLYVAQEFTLTVNGVNTPPQIASTPVTRAAKNQAYTYTVVATDPENDQLTFALGKKPAGMTIDENGTIRWTPQVSQVGQQEVEVLVTDAQGAVTSQTYKIEVSEAAINRAPTIVSTPVYIANVGSAYQYQVRATDQDTGDRLTYQLLSVPAGVNGISIDSTTGLLTWANPVAGNYKIVVGAVDAGGLGAAQGFTLTARANNAPVIRSTPVLTATPGSAYAYDLIASDVDGDRLTYTLDQASLNKGITLDALGRLRWNPAVSNVGTHRIVLTVSDGITSTPQQYDLVVAADTEAPKVRLIANYDTVDLGQTIIFQARATDNVKVAGLRLSIDDTPVVLDANGMARFTPTVAGTIIAKAIATDTAGNPSQEVTFSVLVRDPNDVDAPDVSFHLSGITNGFVTAPTKINANISDPDGNLDYYRLLVAPVSGGEFKELWRNDNPANSVNGELPDQYKFDPSLLQNDSYIVRLEVGDNGGNISYSEEVVDVAGELKLGNFRLSFTDLTVPVTGVPITLTRTYDSLNSGSTDDFGYGWRMEFRDTDLRTSLKRDPDMEELGYHSAFKEGTRVYITLPGGKREAFTFKPKMVQKYEGVYLGQFAQYFYQPEFVADKGGTSTLTVESNFITKGQGTDQFFGFAGNAYNPEDPYFGGKYKLTTKEGVVYEIDAATGDLLTVTDTNGNKLTYTDAGIYSSTGKQVTFERDAQGRIAAVKDPMGELIRYTYDAKGDLISVKDQEQFETKFVYDTTQPHYLKEIIDPLNRTGAKVEYGDDGRLKKTLNATGNSVEIDYDPANSLQTVKDVLGNSTTYEYDTRGNVVRVVDALGNQTRMVYDDNNNLLQVTDANNLVTKYEYDDKSNLKSRTEQYCGCATVTPGTSYYTYDKFGNMETLVTPTGASMIMKYDSYGQMLSMKDGKGNLIQSFSYYANGLVRSETDSTGTTIYEYDDFGNLIQTTDPDGSITIMEYYADGKLRRMVEDHGTPNDTSDDEIFTFEYDKLGREKFVDYGDGIWVKYDYEGAGGDWTKLEAPTIGKIERKFTPNGKLAGWITADGGTPMYKYDAAGRLFRETDASGNDVTEYSYDAAGRVTSVKDLQTGATTSKKYDAGGRVIEEVDTLKVFTRYNYNTRTGRLDSTQSGKYLVNASGNLILDANNNPIVDTTVEIRTYRYEYNGLQTTVIDPLERRTTTVSDDYYLPKETIYQLRDGSKFSEKTEYLYASNLQEAKDYPTRVVDIGGNDRVFEYDELGRLKSATDLGNSKYIYDYGDNGLAKITSPTGETLQYGYDALGNLAKVTYGDNTFKQMTYNTVDNRLETVTLPSGETITYDYDDAGRVRSQTSSTSGSVSFTYTAEGVVETMTDSTGTTTYRYDSNKRLEGIDSPNGSSISYTYDIVGRIKTLTEKGSATATAYTTEYDYDAFDNLSWIKDPAGGITTMKYDVVNRLQERTLPNGVKTTYEYDDLDRVKSIVHTNAQGQVLASVTYERQGIGEPSKIIREDGSYVKLEYDSALRVEQESYYNAAGQLLNEASYTYDASGKRQVQSTSTGERTFNYSTGYQLDTVTEAGETENYDYDANGRLTLIERDGKTLDLNHDAYDRLTSVENETTGQTTQYIYDGQGNRVKAIEGTQERRFLVAPAMGGGLQSTDLITDSSGNLISNYIYGGGSSPFMRLDANGNAVYYLTDAMGSVIGLADNSGASSGKFLYDAFGNTLSQVGGADADTGGDFRFQGQWLESESGLYHFRARDYDPATGLFLSRDPVNIIETVPESFNPYQFVYNNPYIYSDPTGMITINEIGIARQVENILRTIGEKAKNEGVKEAINKAKGTVTDIVQDFISDLIPVSDELQWLYDTVAGTGDVGKIGNPFEMLLIDVILCPILQSGGLANWLWREVPIDKSSGKAIDNGYQCGQEPSKMPRVRPGSTARPDFVISAFPPKETSPFGVSIVSKKAWLIGDLKASVEKAYSEVTSKSEDNQWDAIRNFARKYQYVPVSSYVTLFSDSKLANQAKKEALSQGVYLRFISILQDKNPS
ncbi:putative Ig domain-containing protein [Nostoc punctiforme]|nr:putative Ig domain-containing protein [Nostoc punctiforme]